MLYPTKDEEASLYVARFKWMFRRKFGCTPLVKYKLGLKYFNGIKLEELAHIVNIKLQEKSPTPLPNGIATRCRYRYIVEYRHMFFKIAKDMGFGVVAIGKIVDYDHASVVHGAKSINNLLAIGDKNITQLHSEIETAIFAFLNEESIVSDDFSEIKNNNDEVFV